VSGDGGAAAVIPNKSDIVLRFPKNSAEHEAFPPSLGERFALRSCPIPMGMNQGSFTKMAKASHSGCLPVREQPDRIDSALAGRNEKPQPDGGRG